MNLDRGGLPPPDARAGREMVYQFSDVWSLAGAAVFQTGLMVEALDAVRRLIAVHASPAGSGSAAAGVEERQP